MRLIHRIASVDQQQAACETIADQSIATLFPSNDGVDTCVGVELIAQSAAIPLLLDHEGGAPMQGMLVQIRRFESYQRSVPLGSMLVTKTNLEELAEGAFTMAHGSVFLGEQLICEGTITLAIQPTS